MPQVQHLAHIFEANLTRWPRVDFSHCEYLFPMSLMIINLVVIMIFLFGLLRAPVSGGENGAEDCK